LHGEQIHLKPTATNDSKPLGPSPNIHLDGQ
jgi:hypothetical protein